jgi:hypothetical protein
MDQPTDQWTDGPTNQPTNQTTNQPMDEVPYRGDMLAPKITLSLKKKKIEHIPLL